MYLTGSEESGQSYKICFQAKNSRGDNAVTFENKLDERCYTIHVSTEGERIQRTIDSTVPEMLEEAVAVVEMQTMSAMEKLKKVREKSPKCCGRTYRYIYSYLE